jgi:hypothetical protein
MLKTFNLKETLEKIDLYAEVAYSKEPIPGMSKVFYRFSEWSGWRFYLKALRHRDWKSIRGHIKNEYLSPNN